MAGIAETIGRPARTPTDTAPRSEPPGLPCNVTGPVTAGSDFVCASASDGMNHARATPLRPRDIRRYQSIATPFSSSYFYQDVRGYALATTLGINDPPKKAARKEQRQERRRYF